jgi:hypothetical protein
MAAPMTSDQQLHTLLTAQRFGGNFMRKLADAGLAADPITRAHLLLSFPKLGQTFGPHSTLYSEDLG